MTRQSFPFVLLFSLVIVSYLVINQHQSAPLTKNFNTGSINFVSQRKKFSSLINRTENIVRRFRCLKGWKQFGGKCYHPSIITSSVDKANEKCNLLYGNTTHLMRIEHSAELSYAAYQYIKHDLTTLLVEVDPQVLKSQKFIDMILKNDQVEWKTMEENLAQVQNNFEDQIKLSNSTNINQNDSFDENDNDFDPFNNTSGLCHQFAWSVTNTTNSRFLTFSTYKIGDKLICSLSDIDMNINYEHLCQYVLDICFANIICGKYGRCVNYLQAFKCSCSLFFDGNRCEKFSYQILEMFIVLFLILFVIIWRLSKLLRSFITWIINKGVGSAIKIRNVSSATSWSWQRFKKELDKKRFIRLLLVIILTICCVLFSISITFLIYSLKFELKIDKFLSKSNQCKPEYFSFLRKDDGISVIISIVLMIIYFSCVLFERRKKQKKESSKVNRSQNSTDIELTNRNGENPETVPFINIESSGENSNSIHAPSNRNGGNAENQSVLNNHSVIPYQNTYPETKSQSEYFYPMEMYGYNNRYETSAIFGILTFEILKMFDELLTAKSGSSDDGVIRITLKRILVVFLLGIRYYPSFISLGFKNLIVRCLTLIHMIIIIIYTIYRESFCLDFMPHSQNFTIIDEFQFLTSRKKSFIVYGVIANLPHFILLSYICIEFSMRLIFDSYYKSKLKEEKVKEEKNKEKEKEYKLSAEASGAAAKDRSSFEKFCDWIYKWDENFRYSTIVLSTYLVNYIILFHLICTFSFLYTTRKMNSISFITNILEKILYIKIEDQLYSGEVIFAAILTGLIYALQLFMAMKNSRKQLKKYRGKHRKQLIEETGIKKEEARSKAIQYPGYVIRYTVGGFVITFHILLFIILIPRQIYFHFYTFKWILGTILPIILLYIMQLGIAKSIGKLIDSGSESNADDNNTQTKKSIKDKVIFKIKNILKPFILIKNALKSFILIENKFVNMKNILQYFILVANCLIGILSTIIRLITGFALNIIYINRIDFSLYEEPFELHDSAYVAYWSFIYEQIPYIDHQPNDESEQIENLSKPSDGDKELDTGKSNDKGPDKEKPDGEEFDEKSSPDNPPEEIIAAKKPADDEIPEDICYSSNFPDNLENRQNSKEISPSATLDEQLLNIDLQRIRIKGDGNCFFRAISHQLYSHENNHRAFRLGATNYIRSNPNEFEPSIVGNIEQMEKDGIYADHPIILATALHLKRVIFIHEKGKNPLLILGSYCIKDQVHVAYYRDKKHYESVCTINGEPPILLSGTFQLT